MGLGPYGAEKRLTEARNRIFKELADYQKTFGGPPQKIIFDVFGFSRGAMLARHFVNMVHAGLPDIQRKTKENIPSIYPDMRSTPRDISVENLLKLPSSKVPMYLRLEAEVKVRFLGIFDSVGSFYWPRNNDEGFINANLADHSADFVYHLTARDEIRKNFPLTRITPEDGSAPSNFVEEEFFGAHSDIGGGYSNEPEKLLVAWETYEPQVDHYEYGEDDPEWKEKMSIKKQDLEKSQRIQCLLDVKWNTAYFFELRPTKPELSLVALNAMHRQALSQGVPFSELDPKNEVPAELASLVARAQGGDPYAEKQLDETYIHTSHRKLLTAYIDKTIGLSPEENGLRNCFPNKPNEAIQPQNTKTRSV